MAKEGYDLAFRAGPVADEDLVVRPLWTSPQVLAASRSFVQGHLGGAGTMTRSQLERVPAIVSGTSGWRFASSTIAPSVRVQVNDPRVAILAAAAGLGLLRTSRAAAQASGLVLLATGLGDPLPMSLYAVYPAGRFLPSRVRLAIDWVRRAIPGDAAPSFAEKIR